MLLTCRTALVSFKSHRTMCNPKDVTVQYMPLFVMYVGDTTMDKPVFSTILAWYLSVIWPVYVGLLVQGLTLQPCNLLCRCYRACVG